MTRMLHPTLGAVVLIASCAAGRGELPPQNPEVLPQEVPKELELTFKRFRPGEGYRFVAGIDRPVAWATPETQTPTGFGYGTQSYHFADVGRKWATRITIPTMLDRPSAVSPDGRYVASFGALGKTGDPLEEKDYNVMQVVSIADGLVVWHLKTPVSYANVRDIRWISGTSLLYAVDREKENPEKYRKHEYYVAIMQLEPATGKEREIYRSPPGRDIWSIHPSPSAKRIVISEETEKKHVYLPRIVLLDGESPKVVDTAMAGAQPWDVYWWPDEKYVYFEDKDYRPMELAVDDPKRPTPLSDKYPVLRGARVWGNLSPSGKRLLFSDNEEGKLKLLNLESGKCEEILLIGRNVGGFLRQATWSKEETLAGGWIQTSWVSKELRAAAVVRYPFIVDLERKQVTFFRQGKPWPIFFIENPEVVEALKKRAVPWK